MNLSAHINEIQSTKRLSKNIRKKFGKDFIALENLDTEVPFGSGKFTLSILSVIVYSFKGPETWKSMNIVKQCQRKKAILTLIDQFIRIEKKKKISNQTRKTGDLSQSDYPYATIVLQHNDSRLPRKFSGHDCVFILCILLFITIISISNHLKEDGQLLERVLSCVTD
ncbi:hypothetical protein BD770DRAFT_411075 [Pilaira anomala]|nr:hypothetical protein BD770DRAFT_411075 [Pilaira anomala]